MRHKESVKIVAKLCDGLDCMPSHHKVIQKQRHALAPFIGSLVYDESFDHKKMDRDLVKIINKKKR